MAREPRLAFRHIDQEEWQEVKAQLHGDRRVSVWEKYVEWTPERLAIYAKYDPGMVLERHSHMSDHIVFVLEGEVTIGDQLCTKGMHVMLEKGAAFGPLVAGPQGTIMYEIMMGDPRSVPDDPEGFKKLCEERGVNVLPNPPVVMPDWMSERLD